MLGQTYEGQDCSAARALELVGERWSLLIIRDAVFRGTTRFADFQRSLGLATNVLSARLDRFVAAGLMERRPLTNSKYDEYVVTEMGLALKPVVIALTHWGHHWAGGPPGVFKHADCGGPVEQQLVCTRCGESVAPDEVTGQRGPSDPKQDPVRAA
jgi:DNA-binding HxlR family transcriptional regulator